jgi:zinc transport system substrate-binding protein
MNRPCYIKPILAAVALTVGVGAGPALAEIKVAATIKPVHSLVAAVMAGVGEPALLLEGPASPHVTALRPSQAQIIEDSDVVFAVGEGLEAFLHRLIESSDGTRIVELAEAPGIELLDYRDNDHASHDDHAHGGDDHAHGGDNHAHNGDDHAHNGDDHAHNGDDHAHNGDDHAHNGDDHAHNGDDHAHNGDDHAHNGDDHAHNGDDHAADDHAHEHDHEHVGVDPHIWLDPENGKAMARHIATVLSAADPANAQTYKNNAHAMAGELDALASDLAARLGPVKDRPYLVFHDAYQYLEARYDLNGLGAIVLNPETTPGARRLQEIRQRIDEAGVVCVFSEPQFEVGYVRTVLEGSGARTASLDPLGVTVEPGPDAYSQVLIDLTDALADCLAAG